MYVYLLEILIQSIYNLSKSLSIHTFWRDYVLGPSGSLYYLMHETHVLVDPPCTAGRHVVFTQRQEVR
jgi:hypothetical protein